MNSTRYKVLGYAVWHGGRWYVRRRYLGGLRSARRTGRWVGLGGLLALAALAANRVSRSRSS